MHKNAIKRHKLISSVLFPLPWRTCYRPSLIDNGMLRNVTAASLYALHHIYFSPWKGTRLCITQLFFHRTRFFFFMLEATLRLTCAIPTSRRQEILVSGNRRLKLWYTTLWTMKVKLNQFLLVNFFFNIII